MSKSFTRVLIALALSFIIVGAAFADPIELALDSWHVTEVPLIDGVPSYTSAAFSRVQLRPAKRKTTLTEEVAALTGTLAISGGNFKYGSNFVLNNGVDASSGQTFDLVCKDTAGRNRVRFNAVNGEDIIWFAGTESNEGMSGYTVSWTFTDNTLVANGSGTIPSFTSTAAQLASGVVPYVSLTISNNTVTGITWRFVNPSNPSTPLTSVSGLEGLAIEIDAGDFYCDLEGLDLSGNASQYTDDDDATQNISFSLDEEDIQIVVLPVINGVKYMWVFRPVAPAQQFMFRSKVKSYLSDGKSTYDNVSFKDVGFTIEDASEYYFGYRGEFATDAEAEATGTLTITNAQAYTYGTDSSNTTSVSANTSQQFNLYNEHEDPATKNYRVANSSGTQINFYGGAESGAFKGAVLTANFASMPEMNGSATVPSNFYTMSEQMNYAVPYIELITSGSNVTGVRWRVVKASDPDTALTLNDVPDFRRIRVEPYDNSGRMTTAVHRVNRRDLDDGAVLEGTLTFDDGTYALLNIKYFRTFIDLFPNDDTDNFNRFVWNFYTESASSNEAVVSADTGVPQEATVSSTDVANNLGVDESDIKTLTDENATITEREAEDVSESDLAALTTLNRKAILILPVLVIKNDGIYLFSIKIDLSYVGQRLFFNIFKQTETNSPAAQVLKSALAADDDENDLTQEGGYVFLDADGNSVDEVPADGVLNVAVNLKAGNTYAPIVSVATNTESETDDTSSHGSSSGCSLSFGGLAGLLALSFIALKRRF